MYASPWQLCARIVNPGSTILVVKAPYIVGRYTLWDVAAPTQLPTIRDVIDIPAAHPHFPYGEPALPD